MIPASHTHLQHSTATHQGMRDKNNEDRFGVFTYQLAADNPTPVVFAVLCDGIGGHRAGEVAAEIAVETIRQAVASSRADQPLATLRQGIQVASQAILDQAGQDTERKGMGATCVCAWVIGDRLYTASVGDSRLYLLRQGAIRQLTTDHTWIQEALTLGVLTPEQAYKHPNQHVIQRYLGSAEPPEVDFRLKLDPAETDEQAQANQGLHLQPGDCLVLCSDGLSDLVKAEEILQAVKTQTSPGAPQVLVRLANARGGHDNITVVLLKYPGSAETKTVLSMSSAQTQEQSTAPTVVSRQAAPTSSSPPAQPAPGKPRRWSGGTCLVLSVAGLVLVLLAALLLA